MMSESNQRKVIVAGGTGFLGTSLVRELVRHGHEPIVLTRGAGRAPAPESPARHVQWDARDSRSPGAGAGAWVRELEGAAAIVNLVGRSVDCRKTAENRRAILESRINSVRALAAAWAAVRDPPPVWVQSATAHIFGDTCEEILDERSPIGNGFAPQVGTAWERAFDEAHLPACRRVVFRISFVLGRNGGALRTLARLARLGLGGTVGSGRQYISWIHESDLNRLFLRAIEDESMRGMYVVTAPNPVTNRQFMRELRRAVRRPWSPPAPAPLVRAASWVMRTDPELALLGRRCVPTRLLNEGFTFQFPEFRESLEELLGTPAGVGAGLD